MMLNGSLNSFFHILELFLRESSAVFCLFRGKVESSLVTDR